MVEAYRVHHKTHQTPCKGGLRFTDYNTVEDLKAISIFNSLRAALLSIPYGGSKGLIKINPTLYTAREIEILTRRYTMEFAKK